MKLTLLSIVIYGVGGLAIIVGLGFIVGLTINSACAGLPARNRKTRRTKGA